MTGCSACNGPFLGDHLPGCPVGPAAKDDPVNHPKHYTSHPSGVECITIVEHMTFCTGNAVKYCWRAGLKDDPGGTVPKKIEDLKKAVFYLNREIERLTK